MLHQAKAPTMTMWSFFTHNRQTFKHNALINELLLIQFHLFNIRSELCHWKWGMLHNVNRRNMHTLFSVCSL